VSRPSLYLFVAQTPFQLYVASRLAGRPDYAAGRRVLLTDLEPLDCGFPEADWEEVVRVEPLAEKPLVERFRIAYGTAASLLQPGQERAVLVVSNLEHPLSNAVYALLRRTRRFELHVYPEGLANLVPTRWTPRRRMNQYGKWLLTRLGGAPFVPIGPDLTGAPLAQRIYTFFPQWLPPEQSARAVAIRLEQDAAGPPEAATLVLGQDLDRFMPRKRAEAWLIRLLRFAQGLGEVRLYYKPHHHEADWMREIAVAEGAEVVQSLCPAEAWLLQHPVERLVSFASSALIHGKLLFGSRLQAYAFHPEALRAVPGTSPQRLLDIKGAFRRAGVHVVEPGGGAHEPYDELAGGNGE